MFLHCKNWDHRDFFRPVRAVYSSGGHGHAAPGHAPSGHGHGHGPEAKTVQQEKAERFAEVKKSGDQKAMLEFLKEIEDVAKTNGIHTEEFIAQMLDENKKNKEKAVKAGHHDEAAVLEKFNNRVVFIHQKYAKKTGRLGFRQYEQEEGTDLSDNKIDDFDDVLLGKDPSKILHMPAGILRDFKVDASEGTSLWERHSAGILGKVDAKTLNTLVRDISKAEAKVHHSKAAHGAALSAHHADGRLKRMMEAWKSQARLDAATGGSYLPTKSIAALRAAFSSGAKHHHETPEEKKLAVQRKVLKAALDRIAELQKKGHEVFKDQFGSAEEAKKGEHPHKPLNEILSGKAGMSAHNYEHAVGELRSKVRAFGEKHKFVYFEFFLNKELGLGPVVLQTSRKERADGAIPEEKIIYKKPHTEAEIATEKHALQERFEKLFGAALAKKISIDDFLSGYKHPFGNHHLDFKGLREVNPNLLQTLRVKEMVDDGNGGTKLEFPSLPEGYEYILRAFFTEKCLAPDHRLMELNTQNFLKVLHLAPQFMRKVKSEKRLLEVLNAFIKEPKWQKVNAAHLGDVFDFILAEVEQEQVEGKVNRKAANLAAERARAAGSPSIKIEEQDTKAAETAVEKELRLLRKAAKRYQEFTDVEPTPDIAESFYEKMLDAYKNDDGSFNPDRVEEILDNENYRAMMQFYYQGAVKGVAPAAHYKLRLKGVRSLDPDFLVNDRLNTIDKIAKVDPQFAYRDRVLEYFMENRNGKNIDELDEVVYKNTMDELKAQDWHAAVKDADKNPKQKQTPEAHEYEMKGRLTLLADALIQRKPTLDEVEGMYAYLHREMQGSIDDLFTNPRYKSLFQYYLTGEFSGKKYNRDSKPLLDKNNILFSAHFSPSNPARGNEMFFADILLNVRAVLNFAGNDRNLALLLNCFDQEKTFNGNPISNFRISGSMKNIERVIELRKKTIVDSFGVDDTVALQVLENIYALNSQACENALKDLKNPAQRKKLNFLVTGEFQGSGEGLSVKPAQCEFVVKEGAKIKKDPEKIMQLIVDAQATAAHNDDEFGHRVLSYIEHNKKPTHDGLVQSLSSSSFGHGLPLVRLMGVIDNNLAYADVGKTAPGNTFSLSQRHYGEELNGLLTAQNSAALQRVVGNVQQRFLGLMQKAGFAPANLNAHSRSVSWALWDIAKQAYLQKNPKKYAKARRLTRGVLTYQEYPLGNPLIDQQVQQDMVDRQFGWELYEQSKNTTNRDIIAAHLVSTTDKKVLEIRALFNKTPKGNGTLSSLDLTRLGKLMRELIEAPVPTPPAPSAATPLPPVGSVNTPWSTVGAPDPAALDARTAAAAAHTAQLRAGMSAAVAAGASAANVEPRNPDDLSEADLMRLRPLFDNILGDKNNPSDDDIREIYSEMGKIRTYLPLAEKAEEILSNPTYKKLITFFFSGLMNNMQLYPVSKLMSKSAANVAAALYNVAILVEKRGSFDQDQLNQFLIDNMHNMPSVADFSKDFLDFLDSNNN